MKKLFLFFILSTILLAQNNFDNKYRLAKIYLQNGESEKAKQILIELNSAQPWNQTYLVELNNIYLSLKEYQSSIELLTKRIDVNPKDISSYGLLGSTYFIIGETEKAYQTWDKVFEVVTISPNIYRMMANYPIENRAFDKAIEYLKKGQSISNDPDIFAYDLANLYTATMNYRLAAEEYCKMLSRQSQQLEIIKSRIISFIDRQDALEPVLKVVEDYFQKQKSKEFNELYFSLLLYLKKYELAFNTMLQLHKNANLDSKEILYFGNLFLREKAFALSKKTFEYYLQLNNAVLQADAKIGLAKSSEWELEDELKKNYWLDENYWAFDSSVVYKFQSIILLYEEISNSFTNSETTNEALFRKSGIYMNRLYDFNKALEGFEKLSSKFPFSKFALQAKEKSILCKILLNRLDEASNDIFNFSKYPHVKNDNLIYANFLLAKINFWKAQFSEALKLLSSVTENLASDEANDAIELSVVINFNSSDSLNLSKYAEADLLFEQRNYTHAEKIFSELSLNESLVILSKYSKYRLAETKISLKDYPAAMALLNEISKEEISFLNDKCAFLQGIIYFFIVKDLPKARLEFNKLLEKYPNSIFVDKTRDLINQIDLKEKEIYEKQKF